MAAAIAGLNRGAFAEILLFDAGLVYEAEFDHICEDVTRYLPLVAAIREFVVIISHTPRDSLMWFSTPIYERIPQFWFLLGLLFMSSGTYLSFEYEASFVYFGVGFTCCGWSIWIFAKRFINRNSPQPVQ